MDMSTGPVHGPFTLEKRYIDVLAPDGAVLLVYLGWMNVAGLSFRRVTAELFRPAMLPLRGAASATQPRGGPEWLDYGSARIEGETLSFATRGLSGRLRFRPRHPPVAAHNVVRLGSRGMEWTIEVPDAEAEGELRWPGGSLLLAGRGYRDRVWMDLLPWRSTLRDLVWGRIAAAEHASTWLRLRTVGEETTAGWVDGRVAAIEECEGSLERGRVLLEGGVADLEGLELGVLRPVFRRLFHDPHQVKWACPAVLHGAKGVAIHEHVTWR
jgi:hypothetical protein